MQRFFAASSVVGGPSQPPATLTAVRLWASARGYAYQTSGFGTLAAANGDPVGGLRGFYGAGWDGTQATAGARPSLQTGGINGHRSLQFDGAATYLDWGNLATLDFDRTDPFTIYLVILPTSTTNALREVLTKWDTGASRGWAIAYDGSGAATPSQIQVTMNDPGTGQTRVGTPNGSVAPSAAYVIVVRNSGSGVASGLDIFVNGVKQTLTVFNDLCRGTIKNTASVQLGAVGGSLFFLGQIAEAVACAASHVDADVQANSAYLNSLGYGAF